MFRTNWPTAHCIRSRSESMSVSPEIIKKIEDGYQTLQVPLSLLYSQSGTTTGGNGALCFPGVLMEIKAMAKP